MLVTSRSGRRWWRKSVNDIVTIPINGPLVESKNIFEVHNTGTQTESLAAHGLQKIYDYELVDDDHMIDQSIVIHDVDNFPEEMPC